MSENDELEEAPGVSLRELAGLADEDDGQDQTRHSTVEANWTGEAIPAAVAPYLKKDERQVIPTRQHPVRLALPGAVFAGGALAAIITNAVLYAAHDASRWLVWPVWWAWLIAAAWSIARYAEWRQRWFVVTRQRLIVVSGILRRNVDMLPIAKLRDLHYEQSATGRFFGYATFICDSIGTEASLKVIMYIPYAEYFYTTICELVMPADGKRGPGNRSGESL